MPRYDFQCPACGTVQEHTFRMAEKPPQVPCACGEQAETVFSADIEVFVHGKPIRFTKPVAVPGWTRGADPDAAEREYARQVREAKKQARAQKRSLSRKPGIELKAKIPEALLHARMQQFGRNYWCEEGKKALRRDDLLID